MLLLLGLLVFCLVSVQEEGESHHDDSRPTNHRAGSSSWKKKKPPAADSTQLTAALVTVAVSESVSCSPLTKKLIMSALTPSISARHSSRTTDARNPHDSDRLEAAHCTSSSCSALESPSAPNLPSRPATAPSEPDNALVERRAEGLERGGGGQGAKASIYLNRILVKWRCRVQGAVLYSAL